MARTLHSLTYTDPEFDPAEMGGPRISIRAFQESTFIDKASIDKMKMIERSNLKWME